MRNISGVLIAFVLVVCFVLNPFGATAHDGYTYAKGEMITVYDCSYTSATNPRIAGDKLFFMTGTNNNIVPRVSRCYIYDMESREYTLVHTTEPDTWITGGYSWKACINNSHVFWQLWKKNPETDETVIYGNLTNLETSKNKKFLLDTQDLRVGISDNKLFINKRNDERNFSTLYGYDLVNPTGRTNKIAALIDYSNCDTPVVSGPKVAFSKMNSDRSIDIFVYDSETQETIQVTDAENQTFSDKYSLQKDYLYYYSKSTQISCYNIETRERKIVFSVEKKYKRDSVRMIANPDSDYLLLDNAKAKADTYLDGDFENYLYLYNPVADESKKIFISDTYEMMGIFGNTFPHRRLSHGKRVVFQKPGEYGYIYVFDGEDDSITKIDIDRKYRWYINDYNIYGNTIVWTERFHGKRPDGSYPHRMKIFRLEE